MPGEIPKFPAHEIIFSQLSLLERSDTLLPITAEYAIVGSNMVSKTGPRL